MKDKCDILILTATFGLGHIFVSKAIEEHIKSIDNNIRVNIVDIFEITNPKLYKGVYKSYELLIKTSSKLYNYFYYKKSDSEKFQMEDIFYKLYLPKLAKYIYDVRPKVIVSTFPMCSGFVSKYKEEYKHDIPLITCITDVVDSWEWIYEYTDKYMVATEEIKQRLIKKGIDENLIEVTGIPIRKGFLSRQKSLHIMRKYGIKDNDFVIMMMGGGIGLLPDDKEFYYWLDRLKETKTLILTGKNYDLYKKLKKFDDLQSVKVLKYTKNIYEIMSIADILVSKPGGVTVFEAIASQLPVIVYRPELGQEIENAKFIKAQKIGTIVNDLDQLKYKLNIILNDKKYINALSNNIANVSKNIDMNKLSNRILELCNGRKKDGFYIYNKKKYYEIS
ncbi:MGDG synthase family glycosyltransferase [Caldisalinibacter kiritimatiensis]|uniref:Uncharacterized protein n=1 Tax=Caldisalinibacter kiritimatiensis TaxID=1304284 RepID=R1CL98_9FIRM|nr:glycosyltransferase [Caldisalinibacter kiritimatiensis]EOC99465.1 hypothetical protein L21TH_2470 [Caldisalinibacter kiritimatiensis]